MILKLKREIAQLKEELAMATGEQRTDALSEEDLQRLKDNPYVESGDTITKSQNEMKQSFCVVNIFRCKEEVQRYLEDTDPDCTINIGADMRKIQECFRLLKESIKVNSFVLWDYFVCKICNISVTLVNM